MVMSWGTQSQVFTMVFVCFLDVMHQSSTASILCPLWAVALFFSVPIISWHTYPHLFSSISTSASQLLFQGKFLCIFPLLFSKHLRSAWYVFGTSSLLMSECVQRMRDYMESPMLHLLGKMVSQTQNVISRETQRLLSLSQFWQIQKRGFLHYSLTSVFHPWTGQGVLLINGNVVSWKT